MTFGSLTIPFGGTFYSSSTTVSTIEVVLAKLKRPILLTDSQITSKQIKLTPLANTNYIIYYTTVEDSQTPAF